MVEKTIWMLWLQGWENAPDLVKACKASWTRHNANWTIHFLRAETLGEHISASAEFDTLRERAPVILSDIIRNELLVDMAASGLMPPLFACVRSMNGSNWRLHPDFLRSTGRSLEYRPHACCRIGFLPPTRRAISQRHGSSRPTLTGSIDPSAINIIGITNYSPMHMDRMPSSDGYGTQHRNCRQKGLCVSFRHARHSLSPSTISIGSSSRQLKHRC